MQLNTRLNMYLLNANLKRNLSMNNEMILYSQFNSDIYTLYAL